ncbi:MAG: FAD-linked oxidase C-terminal domain-containing protein [Gammaproteobacteria bacterium]|jgi:glycolate oxidase
MHEEQLIRLLENQLPPRCVLSHPDELRPYECDALSAYRQLPLVVVIPETLQQLQATLRLCAQYKAPVVARGSGTGLSGGAMPLGNGVLLSLARFNRILEIDTRNRIARVQPGVTNLAISGAAAPHGLYYAPDPSSQIACSIGGNVAENAGGVHCLKYGLTTHNIQALEILTIDGEQLTIGGPALDSPGYDLLALLTGSEGLLGIIVEVTVKLLPKPAAAQVVLAAFDSVDAAGAAVTATIASGIIPAGLELLDKPAIHAVRRFIETGYPEDASAILLCELDGSREDVTTQIERVSQVYRDAGATSLQVSRDEAERQRFWAGRKAAFPAMGRLSPDYYCMDGTIPRKHLADVLKRIAELSGEYGLPICNVFHAGDGNLHPLILYDANKAGELERTEELGGKILELCVAVGGTITGEHGVGLEKINQMCVQFNSAELQQFHAVKEAFDPENLLNPGKAIPTLHRCAEFGAMHVHHGELPHPELERF